MPLAAPPQHEAKLWTLQIENDAVSTLAGASDQYDTSGQRRSVPPAAAAPPIVGAMGVGRPLRQSA